MSDLAAFVAVSLVLLVTPGPAVLYIVARSVEQGRGAGLLSSLGLATGGAVHVAATTVGASALVAASPVAFTALRYAGASYLLVLGVRQLVTRDDEGGRRETRAAAPRRIYGEGVLVSLLNPKAIVFFLAFLPQFADPARGALAPQLLRLGAIFLSIALATDSAYALLAGTAGAWIRAHPSAGRLTRRVSGVVYLALAAATALG